MNQPYKRAAYLFDRKDDGGVCQHSCHHLMN